MTTQYLIRDDGQVVVEANSHTLKLPNFKPYQFPVVKAVEEVKPSAVVEVEPERSVDYAPDDAEFDVEWASKAACIAYAKENFGVDISKEKSLAKLRAKVKELLNGDSSSNNHFAGTEYTS